MPLPINIEDLLSARTVESDRIEFKEGWNPDAIYRSICAFANDFDNLGGGHIVVGVEESNGIAKRPAKGLLPEQLAAIQQKMIGLNNLIKPVYHPKVFVEDVDGKQILVIWVPGGSDRPYEVPDRITANHKNYHYYIRRYANSVEPIMEEKQDLISLANQVPFDDRPNTQAAMKDIDLVLLRNYLHKTGSRLAVLAETLSKTELLNQMQLLSGPPEQQYPRNVTLMLFCEHPERFFPETRIEIVHFPEGPANPEFFEASPITGPVQYQITNALDYLKTKLLQEKVKKVSGQAEALRFWNYPCDVLEEAVANAIYHRDYQVREPVKIRIYPDSIVITNAGGPDRAIRMDELNAGKVRPKRYRNRRLGSFLKDLKLTEGHATGIITMRHILKANGSPDPVFDTDNNRTWFELKFLSIPTLEAYQRAMWLVRVV